MLRGRRGLLKVEGCVGVTSVQRVGAVALVVGRDARVGVAVTYGRALAASHGTCAYTARKKYQTCDLFNLTLLRIKMKKKLQNKSATFFFTLHNYE